MTRPDLLGVAFLRHGDVFMNAPRGIPAGETELNARMDIIVIIISFRYY